MPTFDTSSLLVPVLLTTTQIAWITSVAPDEEEDFR